MQKHPLGLRNSENQIHEFSFLHIRKCIYKLTHSKGQNTNQDKRGEKQELKDIHWGRKCRKVGHSKTLKEKLISLEFLFYFTKGATFINNKCSLIHEDFTRSKDLAIK
jgi:hypothetical protein